MYMYVYIYIYIYIYIAIQSFHMFEIPRIGGSRQGQPSQTFLCYVCNAFVSSLNLYKISNQVLSSSVSLVLKI